MFKVAPLQLSGLQRRSAKNGKFWKTHSIQLLESKSIVAPK